MNVNMDLDNVKFMLDSIKILLECGEVDHALLLIDAYQGEVQEWEEKKSTQNPATAETATEASETKTEDTKASPVSEENGVSEIA